jgi:hypothetical protein
MYGIPFTTDELNNTVLAVSFCVEISLTPTITTLILAPLTKLKRCVKLYVMLEFEGIVKDVALSVTTKVSFLNIEKLTGPV